MKLSLLVLSGREISSLKVMHLLFRSYISPFSQDDFPVEFYIRDRIYLETCVDTEDDRLSILALECYATPSQDRDSTPRYDIISDG